MHLQQSTFTFSPGTAHWIAEPESIIPSIYPSITSSLHIYGLQVRGKTEKMSSAVLYLYGLKSQHIFINEIRVSGRPSTSSISYKP